MNRKGLTLIELLVCISILALLTGLILAAVQNVRGEGARLDCQNRLKQLGLAAQNHHAAHKSFPSGVWYPFNHISSTQNISQAGISWQTALLPYLEQEPLWQEAWQAHVENPIGIGPTNAKVAAFSIPAFRCPTDSRERGKYSYDSPEIDGHPGWGLTNYVGVAGTSLYQNDGMLHPNFNVALTDIHDGSSNTIFMGERPTAPNGYGNSWYSGWGTKRFFYGQLLPVGKQRANQVVEHAICPPNLGVFQAGKYDDPCYQGFFWSRHNGGANFAYADGSVRFLSYSAAAILPALATRSGGESLGD